MTCRACGGLCRTVFVMDPMPLAGAFATTQDEAIRATRYPLEWQRCTGCGLVNVTPDIPDADIYAAYSYVTGDVPALVAHHERFARYLSSFGAGLSCLDIGGNDGTLLSRLPASWHKVNVDPSDIARTRRRQGYELINAPFTSDVARGLGRFDFVVSSNAFAHFSGIEDALVGVSRVLHPEGRFIVEVHDLEATLSRSQWDTIYHEHKVEWSEDSLRVAAARHGLRLFAIDHLPLHGGLIRATFIARIGTQLRPGPSPDFRPLRRAYADREPPTLPAGAVAYGAAARASVYLNQVPMDLRYIVDGSPRRHGHYVPGVGLPIVAPERFENDRPPAALITAWNHAADIRARHPGYDRWVTAW